MVDYNHYNLFPTLVMTFDLSKSPFYNKMLTVVRRTHTKEHMLMKNSESSYDESTINTWLDQPMLEELKDTFQQCLDVYTTEYQIAPVMIGTSWMNRVKKGGSVRSHRHEMSVLSGAFYPEADEGSTGLIFKSPLTPYRMNEFAMQESIYNSPQQEFPCEQGTLILFPSWLEHYTEDNNTDKRVTVSFNTTYRPKSW